MRRESWWHCRRLLSNSTPFFSITDQHKIKKRKSSKTGNKFSKTTPKAPAYKIRSDCFKPSDKDT